MSESFRARAKGSWDPQPTRPKPAALSTATARVWKPEAAALPGLCLCELFQGWPGGHSVALSGLKCGGIYGTKSCPALILSLSGFELAALAARLQDEMPVHPDFLSSAET